MDQVPDPEVPARPRPPVGCKSHFCGLSVVLMELPAELVTSVHMALIASAWGWTSRSIR
jgi:hypothetical protein